MTHKVDGKSEHKARVGRILGRYASGGVVQQNAKSLDRGVKNVTGKTHPTRKPLFKAGGKASHKRLDKHARGGAVKLKKGGKAESKGNKINIVVAPHPPVGGAAPGGLAGAAPPPMPPRPIMGPPPGAMPPGGAPIPAGVPPGLPPRPPGMARGGKIADSGVAYKKGGSAHKAAGGSTSNYDQSKQTDLGEESESKASNADQHPPFHAKGGKIRHTMRHPKSGRFMKGGKVHMEYGSGSGLGRLEKAKEYGETPIK